MRNVKSKAFLLKKIKKNESMILLILNKNMST